MIAAGHTSVGVIIGLTVAYSLPQLPLPATFILAGAAGLASHYLMDLLPHGHYNFDASQPSVGEKIKLLIDVVITIIVFLGLFILLHGLTPAWWLILAGIGGAQTPDIIDTLIDTGKVPTIISRNKFLQAQKSFHSSTHWHNPKQGHPATNQGGLPLGLPRDLWQLSLGLIALLAIIYQ